MGAYDSARVCELVGSFLLYALSLKYNKTNLGWYGDDGLPVFRNIKSVTVYHYHVTYEFQSESTLQFVWMSRESLLGAGAISEV